MGDKGISAAELPGYIPQERIVGGTETYTQTQRHIIKTCDEIKKLLIEKNRKYGDSAMNPIRVFSQASPEEQLRVRIDDKISRMQSGQIDDDEDVIDDLIGYLILLKMHKHIGDTNEQV